MYCGMPTALFSPCFKECLMGGPIVRTGTTPKFWQNYDRIFGEATTKKAAPAKKVAAAKVEKTVKVEKAVAKKSALKKAVSKKKK